MLHKRKSYAEINKIYFFTATIHKFKHLLLEDNKKDLIVNYLKELSSKEFIKVYGFVVMPNYIHLIWEQLKKNGKETPQGSFYEIYGP